MLERWDKPVLTAFSDGDPITRGGARPFESRIPGAQGRAHATITGAGHFLQEDRGPELAAVIVDFVKATPLGCFSPLAMTYVLSALWSPSVSTTACTSPAWLLPTKTVPFAPSAICRAFFTPCAHTAMEKPSGSLMVSSRSTGGVDDLDCCA